MTLEVIIRFLKQKRGGKVKNFLVLICMIISIASFASKTEKVTIKYKPGRQGLGFVPGRRQRRPDVLLAARVLVAFLWDEHLYKLYKILGTGEYYFKFAEMIGIGPAMRPDTFFRVNPQDVQLPIGSTFPENRAAFTTVLKKFIGVLDSHDLGQIDYNSRRRWEKEVTLE